MSLEKQPLITRRNLIVGGALVGTAALIGLSRIDGQNAPDTGVQPDAVPESLKPNLDFEPIFENEDAKAEVNALGINMGDYFKISAEAVKSISESGNFVREEHLLPIFPPAVMKHAEVIERAAKDNKIPANVLATLASIESSGDTSARSGADAYGLIQVVPRYHLDRFVRLGYLPAQANLQDYQSAKRGEQSVVSKEDYLNALTSPEASARVGAEYFAECIATARKQNPNLPPNDMRVFAIAAASYNGGQGLAGKEYKNFPTESKLYVNHMSRFVLDIEVAARLRAKGKNDEEILRAMQSKEVEARAYSYGKFRFNSFDDYEKRAEYFTYPVPGVKPGAGRPANDEEVLAQRNWEAYKKGQANITNGRDNRYVIPAPPALRIWLAGGGMGLFGNMPENANWRLPA